MARARRPRFRALSTIMGKRCCLSAPIWRQTSQTWGWGVGMGMWGAGAGSISSSSDWKEKQQLITHVLVFFYYYYSWSQDGCSLLVRVSQSLSQTSGVCVLAPPHQIPTALRHTAGVQPSASACVNGEQNKFLERNAAL